MNNGEKGLTVLLLLQIALIFVVILFILFKSISNACADNYRRDDITVNVYPTETVHTTDHTTNVIQNFDYRGTAMGLASDHSYQIDTGAVQSDFVCSTYEGVKACSFGTAKSFDNKYMIKGSIVKSGSKDAATIGVGWRW
jgi:hypothetical protein